MIKAYSNTFPAGIKIEHVVNRGGWFGKKWLVGVGCGYSMFTFLVEADCEQDAIDELVDSKFGHLVKIEETDERFNSDEVDRAGNRGEPVDLTDLRVIERVGKVDWFAPKE